MSQGSFVFNFNTADFTSGSQNFAKTNVVKLERSHWCLGVEKTQTSKDDYSKVLNVFLICERSTTKDNYMVTLELILHGSFIDLHFARMYYFEPMDLEMPCFKMNFNRVSDKVNGFVNKDGEFKITAEIFVKPIASDEEEGLEGMFKKLEGAHSPEKELNRIINLADGLSVRINKELLSWHSDYFKNLFNNEYFDESSQETIDLIDISYKQFRLLRKHIYRESSYPESRYLYTDGTMEFRLKSEHGEKEFETLWNLAEVREYWRPHICTSLETEDDSREKSSKKISCMLNDAEQMETLLGLIFSVSTEYAWEENQTVSAENVEDLLRIGSYFLISKITRNCEEFLRKKHYDPNFSVQRRSELVEKYNFSSVTVLPIIPQDRCSTEILVQVNFLDSGNEEMCSVKSENSMNIRMLFSDALANIYSTGICDLPSKYEIERVRIFDPNTSTGCICIEDRPKLYRCVEAFLIYSFDARQKTEEARTQVDDDFTSAVKPVNPSGSSYNEMFVYVNFLDSDNEQKCSVKYTNIVTVQMHYSDALSILYSEGICDTPSKYEVERVRIFNSNPFVDCQNIDVKNNARFMSMYILYSRQYHFDVRKITEVLTETDDHLTSKANPSGSGDTEMLVYVNFLDFNVEDKCNVRCENAMTIQKLFSDALTNLHSSGSCDPPMKYRLESVRVFNPEHPLATAWENIDVKNNVLFMSGDVLCSHQYHFDVRRIRGEVLTETDDRSSTKTIPFAHLSINDAYQKWREGKVIQTEENEPEHEPIAGTSSQNQTVSVSRLQDVRRSTSTNPDTILILVTFSESQREEICQVLYKEGMKILQMTQRMFWELGRKNFRIPRDYEVDFVHMFNPEFVGKTSNMAMQDLVMPETDSTIYNVQLKRKKKVDGYPTFRST
ncbi:BTB/POZ domain-containing protein [Ditylenchus destructor]|uniref:BTB/POZ domain-containing protein n=1 Tax=Ditylenchus destructor TaxID=166010 RepID=A0AAD4MJS1_9BILA|nr:BTB/POZ domain-containing protein [Ditylenchus destructor]